VLAALGEELRRLDAGRSSHDDDLLAAGQEYLGGAESIRTRTS